MDEQLLFYIPYVQACDSSVPQYLCVLLSQVYRECQTERSFADWRRRRPPSTTDEAVCKSLAIMSNRDSE